MRDEVDTTVTSRVFLDLSIGGAPLGRVTLGLYGNAAPRTAENFRCLCTGERGSVRRKKSDVRLHYKGTSFHRIVPNFLCQGGDVTHDPDGAGGHSIYGRTFDDEGFRVRHEGAGERMANEVPGELPPRGRLPCASGACSAQQAVRPYVQ